MGAPAATKGAAPRVLSKEEVQGLIESGKYIYTFKVAEWGG